jgi:cell filamentation protein
MNPLRPLGSGTTRARRDPVSRIGRSQETASTFRPARALEIAERAAVDRTLARGPSAEALAQSAGRVRAIHRHLFQDVYDWAGETRRYTTGRGQAPFARPEFIAPELERRFAALKEDGFLKGLERAAFAERAAHHVNEINAVHPFVEGNGRTQRVWLRELASQAGFELRFERGPQEREAWNEASKIGFHQIRRAHGRADRVAACAAARAQRAVRRRRRRCSIATRRRSQRREALEQNRDRDQADDD